MSKPVKSNSTTPAALPSAEPMPSRLFVQALAHGFAVLETYTNHPGPLSLQAIADRTGLERSMVQRMAYTLVQLGYLRKGIEGRGFCLGSKALDRSYDFLRSWPLIERATPVMDQLLKSSGERVDLSLFDDLTISYAIRRQNKRQTFQSTLIGRRIPTYCSSGGRAIMAHLTDAEVDSILRRSPLTALTPRTLTTPAAIKKRVTQARQDGFSIVHDESLIGEIAVACAVLDNRSRPIAAIHIAGSLADWTVDDFTRRFAPLVTEAASALSGSVAPF